ncbi:MAG: type V CRISPR-associated protein Cas12b [Desulfobulbus sp.]
MAPPILAPTQRAYTLRLQGIDPKDNSWSAPLWETHKAFNKGVEFLGSWLLTLRGGLPHTLEESATEQSEKKWRRVLLALSWLTVESRAGAPKEHIVAHGTDPAQQRGEKLEKRLREILKKRDVAPEAITGWVEDCLPSLEAAIRDDAVWVDRSQAFDQMSPTYPEFTRADAKEIFFSFFNDKTGTSYLKRLVKDDKDQTRTEKPPDEDKVPDFKIAARGLISRYFGTGKKNNPAQIARNLRKLAGALQQEDERETFTGKKRQACIEFMRGKLKGEHKENPKKNPEQNLRIAIGWKTGRSSAGHLAISNLPDPLTPESIPTLQKKFTEEAKEKEKKSPGAPPWAPNFLQSIEQHCGMPFHDNRDHTDEFAVMLAHALRRVSQAHSWIKRAETVRVELEKDVLKIDAVPESAQQWLDAYCRERLLTSGAKESYLIRKRAIEGWKVLVHTWSQKDCTTREQRRAAARALQNDPEIDKFGDIQLFEALAANDAMCVWQSGDGPAPAADHQHLDNYVLSRYAKYKQQKFKVPAYRHPDPLLHPAFCDFGKSQWRIAYGDYKTEDKTKKDISKLPPGQLEMDLWTGSALESRRFRWQSLRAKRDLLPAPPTPQNTPAGPENATTSAIQAARADRLGRAAAGASSGDAVCIPQLHNKKTHWNARLQAPREQLERLAAYVKKHGWNGEARRRCTQLAWLVTFSAQLQPQGPGFDYISRHLAGNKAAQEGKTPKTSKTSTATTLKRLFQDCIPQNFIDSKGDNSRKAMALQTLSRLPAGLRILSVDLGHRYAAACAVWETMTSEAVEHACDEAGHPRPQESDLYLHLKKKAGKKQQGKQVATTTIYRRIGADRLPDGTPHPAPWARLERQFLIRLQGEKEKARAAGNEEIWFVHQLEVQLERAEPLIDRLARTRWKEPTNNQQARLDALRALGWTPASAATPADSTSSGPSISIDELRHSAVRTARLALARHGDRARIARDLIATHRIKPGNISEPLNEEGLVNLLQTALTFWHNLAFAPGWTDKQARKLWDEHIVPLPGYSEPKTNAATGPYPKRREKIREALFGAAQALSKQPELRNTLHDIWKRRWEEDDQHWHTHLRRATDWLLPRGRAARGPEKSRAGGLSLLRLATLTEFRRKVQVAFFTRLRPDGTRNEAPEHFGQRTLDALEQRREQRVKQLASRIVEAALGIGSEGGKGWEGGKRPRERIPEPRFAPCHAVVIENLTNYRPDEVRTRQENRQLMQWSSSKVKTYLDESCLLNGLYLHEVRAAYTSRQDSRTGSPGRRCQDIPFKEFKRQVDWAREKTEQDRNRNERLLCALDDQLRARAEQDKAAKPPSTVRIPREGGEIFVSAQPDSPAARGIQADLNAAANIGLKALMDPDWPGRWWYVPCEASTRKPVQEKVQGSRAADWKEPLVPVPPGTGKNKKASGNIINFWSDISSSPLYGEAKNWQTYTVYWQQSVPERVARVLLRQFGEPVDDPAPRDRSIGDDVPL